MSSVVVMFITLILTKMLPKQKTKQKNALKYLFSLPGKCVKIFNISFIILRVIMVQFLVVG